VNERVKLTLTLKNTPSVIVKVFEFNSENYYRKTMAPFKTDVNLDGLVASNEETHEFKQATQKKIQHTFEFAQLDNRSGLFVIEFLGNGYSSRAVIKKGGLSIVHTPTIAGHIAYILDEDKNICYGDKTGVFLSN
jgi:hypothetical protein